MTCKQCHHLSATSVRCFKSCPMSYFYRYIKRIIPALESEAQRFGTNWHSIMEILGLIPGAECPYCYEDRAVQIWKPDEHCWLCENSCKVPEDRLAAATRYMNQQYAVTPPSKTDVEWQTEKIRLLYAAIAYQKYYADQPLTVLGTELSFDVPLKRNGRVVRGFKLVGKIDKLLHHTDRRAVGILDHKATSHNINDVNFWSRFNMDVQTRFYPYALAEMARQGTYDLANHSVEVMIDAFHKPQTSPKKLTQGESKKFVEDGMYCEQQFEITDNPIRVNTVQAEIEPGAKEGTFAIRETPEMYGARMLQEISAEPQKYFNRRAIPRTDKELNQFGEELLGVAASIRAFEKGNLWYRNEDQCESSFKCSYLPICYEGIDVDREEPIPGFIRKGIDDVKV